MSKEGECYFLNYQIQLQHIDEQFRKINLYPINTSEDVIVGEVEPSLLLKLPGSTENETLGTSLSYIKRYLSNLEEIASIKRSVSSSTDLDNTNTLATSKAIYSLNTKITEVGNNQSNYAIKKHSSSTTDYGIGTASVYGHVKLSDTYASAVTNGTAAKGMGASQYAVYQIYATLTKKIEELEDSVSSHASTNATSSVLGHVKIGSNISITDGLISLTSDNIKGALGYTPMQASDLKPGTGISISSTTITNSGVRSISTGTANGAISVNTNGTSVNVSIYGLKSAAYTESSAYATASHTHDNISITGDTRSVATTPNDYNGKLKISGLKTASVVGSPDTSTFVNLLGFRGYANSNGGVATEFGFTALGKLFKRTGSTTAWGNWAEIIDSSNIGSYAPDLLGTGASGNWNINAATADVATKLGTTTIGGTTKPIYLNAGVPTALSSTIGGVAKPVYLNAGTITAFSTTIGAETTPVYMNAGTVTECTGITVPGIMTAASAGTHGNWGTNGDYVPNMIFINRWNGAWNSSGTSNLAYCNKGAFGTMATKAAADYLPLSGGTMTGNLILKNTLYMNDGVNSRGVIYLYDDGDEYNYGSETVIDGAGNLFIGGGESPRTLRTALSGEDTIADGEVYAANGETMYVSSDTNIYFYSGCNTAANRKGIIFDKNGCLRPLVTNTMYVGSSSYKFNTIYATTFNGALSGNATTATTATKLGTSTVGGTSKPMYLNAGVATALSATVGSSTGPAYLNAGTITACSGRTVPGISETSVVTHASAGTNDTYVPTKMFLCRWNGAYNSSGNSNLAYCNRGAFGTIVTKGSGDYLPISGGTLTGALNFKNNTLNTVGDDAYLGDINIAGAVGIKGKNGSTKLVLSTQDGSNWSCIEMLGESSKQMNIYNASQIALESDVGINVRNLANTAWNCVNASAFVVQSSKRYKKNIKTMTDDIARQILELRPVSYDYINDLDGSDCLGLIAEEADEVNRYQVIYKDEVPEGIDYSRYVPQLIKMIQLQEDKINSLEEKINSLLEKIEV